MKLLIITNLFPNAAEPGRGIFNQQQLAALPPGWQVEVIAPLPWTPRLPGVPQPAAWRVFAGVPERETVQGVTAHHPRYLVIPKIGRWLSGWTFGAAVRPVALRLHRDSPFDAVLATWAYPDVYGAVRAVRGLGLPVVAKVHGSDVYMAKHSSWRRRAIRSALGRCAGVVAVAGALKTQLLEWGVPEGKIRLIPNGVDLKRFRPTERSDARTQLKLPLEGRRIVFVGNLAPVKGLPVLLEAMTRLPDDVTLSLVGDGELRADLDARIKNLGLTGRVTLVGRVPHTAVPLWMNAANAICLSSVSEGCPNVVVEALACGTPVVGTRAGGIPELIHDGANGRLVPVNDARALAEALALTLETAWDRQEIRRSVAQRGWEACTADLAQLLNQAIETARARTVLHVLRYSLPNMSGYTVRSQAIVEGQRAFGVRPVVVTSVRHEGAAADEESINGIRYVRTRLSARPLLRWCQTRPPLLRDALTMAALYRRVLAAARAESAAVIHAHSPVMCGLPALAAARRLRVPLVYEVRALWEDAAVDQEKTTERSLSYHLIRRCETWLLRRADRVVVICDGLKRELVQRGLPADRVAVMPNGVDTRSHQPLQGKDHTVLKHYGLDGHKIVGFIGSFFQFEGLESLLQAVPALRRLRPDVKVMIVGAGEQEERLHRYAAEHHLESTVLFTGRVPHRDIAAYYSVMDVLVYPRLSKRITELVTPLKPLEAMALGRPVVASDVGGLREMVEDGKTGLLFKAGDPEDLAAKCAAVITDGALAAALAGRARAYVEAERDWSAVCRRYAALYEEIAR